MSIKEKIIKRLNEGFGFNIPNNAPYCHHQATFYADGRFSWSISNGAHDIGCTSSMTEALTWDRWVYDTDMREISEYFPRNMYYGCIIEKKKGEIK